MDLFVPIEAFYLLFCTVFGIMQIRQTWYIGRQEVRTIDIFSFLINQDYKARVESCLNRFCTGIK